MKALSRFRWTALAVVLIAVVAAIRFFGTSDTEVRDGLTYAGPRLAQALETSLSAPGTRVLTAFHGDGAPCRAFLGSRVSGIACEERGGWHLRLVRDGVDLDDPAKVAALERELRSAAERMEAQ